MSFGNLWRKILGPIAIVIGLDFLISYAWFLIYSPEETSLPVRIFIAIWGTILTVGFLLVGYNWMGGRTSMRFPKFCNDNRNN